MPKLIVAYAREKRVAPYLEALALCGVGEEEIYLATPGRTNEVDLSGVVAEADGLLLTGGADLQPCLYHQPRLPGVELDDPNAERDQMEWDLLHHARARALPVFGICRGLQMIDVFLGGSLWQDLALQHGASGHDCFVDRGWALDHVAHTVAVGATAHPFAARLARHAPLEVNSRHHQGVLQLGAGLVPVARAPDGTVEALAWAGDDWWLRAVQWHPENLVAHPAHRELFADFVEEAERARAARRAAAPVTPEPEEARR